MSPDAGPPTQISSNPTYTPASIIAMPMPRNMPPIKPAGHAGGHAKPDDFATVDHTLAHDPACQV